MRKPPRSAGLLRLEREGIIDRVTQEMMRQLEGAQRAEWAASRQAALLSERIRSALKRNVPFEAGPLYFDEDLNMVRSRKRESAG